MKRIHTTILLLVVLAMSSLTMSAQDELPTVDPQGTFYNAEGEELSDVSSAQSAPVVAHFAANPSNLGNYEARYEWKIYEEGKENEPLVHRFEEEIDYTFTKSGSFCIQLYATFVLAGDTINYPQEGEENPIRLSISESRLEFPNAFSPNDDGINDVYKAKEGYQSIVSFHATIVNRWGQKLYSWDNPEGGWDGKVNGHTVRDGVYYVIVNARGADGRHYKIRKDVNVLTGFRTKDRGATED